MKKRLPVILFTAAAIGLTACGTKETNTTTAAPETQGTDAAKTATGQAKGFGGLITAKVTLDGEKITDLEVTGGAETQGIGTKAIEELPGKIVEAGNTNVDTIAGATVTSDAIIAAVNNAIDPVKYPYVEETKPAESEPAANVAAEVYQGLGLSNSGRVGPGKDDKDVSVYSVNQVFANVLFDGDGKILDVYVDQLEYATPNYDGETMPHLTGFPGQSYNNDENHDEAVDGVLEQTEDAFLAQIDGWATKRDRGDGYVMGTGTWSSQMDAFQKMFVGKTVSEVEEWFSKYCSDVNGRPLKEGSKEEKDIAKYEALSQEEKDMLADAVTGATMSLNDSHGNIVAALKDAYEKKVPLEIQSASAMGFGLSNSGRVGPGKDDKDVSVYSINQVMASTLFDADGKIIAITVDQLEAATPNYDGETMPHFTGFPGQSYNNDENHDEKVDGVLQQTDDTFLAEIGGWKTKRERGDGYVMGTGTWASQMDVFQKLFIGKTADEVEEWFGKYCSDVNGRPLQEGSKEEKDITKYNALSQEEKDMLVDAVTGATMSLSDSHGDIIAAIRASFDKKVMIDLTVK